MRTKNKFLSWLPTLIIFLAIFSVYMFNIENYFIIKMRITGLMLYFPIPILFFTIIFIFVYIYSKLLNKSLVNSLFLIFPLAIFWKLAFFVIEMIGADPWRGNKTIFTIYSHAYLTLVISFCLIIIYKLGDYLAMAQQKPIVIIPGITFVSYLIYQIFRTRSYNYIWLIPVTSLILYFLWEKRHIFKVINKRGLLFIVAVFILAFVVRFVWGLRVISLTGNQFYAASDDGVTYGPNAEDWVKGIGGPSAFGSIGGFVYSVFLGVIYKLFGNPNYYAVIFIQAILGALVPVCIYYIAKLISNPYIAKSSAILVSLNMNSVFTSIVVGMEALFIPLIFIFLYLLIKYINNGKIKAFRYPFLIGALLGVANIIRPEVLLFPIVVTLCFFLFNQNRFHRRDISKIIISFILGFSIILFSYCLRNYIKEGKFDFRTESAAITACLVENGVVESKVLCDMGFNPFANLGGSLKIAIKEPLRVGSLLLKGISKKGFNYLFCANFGEMDFLTLLNNAGIGETIYRFSIYNQFYIYLFVLMGLILFFMDKNYLLEKSILLGYIFYTFLFYAIIYSKNARYKAVLEPLFIMLFVNTIYFLIIKFKKVANNKY